MGGQHHHDHGHEHSHEHRGRGYEPLPHAHHDHAHGASARRLTAALGLLGVFTLVEAVGGWYANSIALLAEAGHMLADCASLVLALLAIRMAARAPSAEQSYGYARYQTLAAYTNGVALIALTAWVVFEALQRLLSPPLVDARLMLGVALAGGVANLAAFAVLSGGHSLNERGARAHVLGDLLGSAAAVAAAVLIGALGWHAMDPLLSLAVSVLIFRSGWALTHEASHVLLEGTPAGFDCEAVKRELIAVPGVTGIHHLHAWSLTGDAPIVTLHAALADEARRQQVLSEILARLRERFGVTHATVQIEDSTCADPHPAGHP